MEALEPISFDSFEIDISPQSSMNNCDERISKLRQRLMQFGKIINNFEKLEIEMQQKQRIRAQQSLSKQIIILNDSIKKEKKNLEKLRKKSNDFLENKCKNNFISKTKNLYKILSNQYIESQHEVINKYKIEIIDIQNSIKLDPSQILRLFEILFSINSILSKIQKDVENNTNNNNNNNVNENINLLKSTEKDLIKLIIKILPFIKNSYLKELEKKLKDVSWPKLGNHKVIDLSQPQKWSEIENICFNLLTIEYYIQYMDDNDLYKQISECVDPTYKYKSWVIDQFLQPIIKRFNYNFNSNNNSNKGINKINKPEYFFNFLHDIINDNINFIHKLLQPLILEIGLTLDIEKIFIYGLIKILRKKCKNLINMLLKLLDRSQSNESKKQDKVYKIRLLIRHLIEEMIKFQQKLNRSYSWINNDNNTNIMNEILDVEIMRKEWLKMEKDRINKDSMLISDDINNAEHIFDIHHNDFINKDLNNYFMTNAVYDILIILESLKSRIEIIVNISYRKLFIKELIMQVLKLCTDYIEQEFPNHVHYRVGMGTKDVKIICGIINSGDYLIQFLMKWNEDEMFKSLEPDFFKDIINTNRFLMDKHIFGLYDVICHEFSLEFAQYLNETFSFIKKYQAENEEKEQQTLSIQPEFEDGYFKISQCLYSCSKSLPNRLFEIILNETSRVLDDKICEKILNLKYKYFYGGSLKLKYDLEHLFFLFYNKQLQIVPNINHKRMDIIKVIKDETIDNKFPKLISLLIILTMDKVKLKQFKAALKLSANNDDIDDNIMSTKSLSQIDKEMTFEHTKQILHRYSVDRLSFNQIKKVLNKMTLDEDDKDKKKENNDDNKDNDDDDSDISDFSSDFGTTKL